MKEIVEENKKNKAPGISSLNNISDKFSDIFR